MRARGFSLIEMLIATAITLTVVAGVVAMVQPAQGAFETGLEFMLAVMQARLTNRES